MDSGTLIVGTILVVLCILPVILTERSRKKKEKRLYKHLASLAEAQNCKITKYERCCNMMIGIDEINNHVFFIKKSKEGEKGQYINLREIQNCRIRTTGRTVEESTGGGMVTEKLELVFMPVLKSGTEIVWEIYNAEDNLQLSGELQLIEKWAGIIKEKLKVKKK